MDDESTVPLPSSTADSPAAGLVDAPREGLTRPARPRASRIQIAPGVMLPGSRYRIDGWLGDGHSGVVYEATNVELERRVAIKVLHDELSARPDALHVFQREARAASRIGSPYIVEALDFLTLPDGRTALVMERLQGRSLDTEVGRAPMPLERLIPILRQLCQAMAAAHDQGIVHRDLKPDNVFLLHRRAVAAGGRVDRIKVIDFGLAAVVGSSVAIGGTAPYMAPEQVRGLGVSVGSDIYAVGCIAYELLCGRPPFIGDACEAVLRAHLDDAPVSPAERAGPAAVPAPIERWILRCLEKEPSAREPSMRALEASLCEAQVALRLVTAWDDLPIPEVGAARTQALERQLRAPRASARASPRWRWWALSAAVLGTAVALTQRGDPPPESAADDSPVERLASDATAAAARALFVYPPVDAPRAATALAKVMELEGLGSTTALARAATLRRSFTETLVRLGDEYWEMPGGRPFSVDFYAQALLFTPAHERARERGGLTLGQISELRRRAREADFTATELAAAEPLAALAEPDRRARARKLRAVMSRSARRSRVGQSDLAALLGSIEDASGDERAPSFADGAVADGVVADGVGADGAVADGAVADGAGVDGAELGRAELDDAPPDPESAPRRRDAARARELAREGRAILRKGRWSSAQQKFHQALAHDNRCGPALMGLSDLHFELAQYDRAVQFGQRAVGRSPRNGEYRIKLGDAYVKALRYRDAAREYDQAQALGHPEASRRRAKLRGKLGAGSP